MHDVGVLVRNTPVEEYQVDGRVVYVKREDLACPPPGPPFAKVRGLYVYLKGLTERGCRTVGYMDTSISMAGWGIAYLSKCLGLHAVLFYPQYRDGLRHNQRYQLERWAEFEAEIVPLRKPSQRQINIHRAKRAFLSKYSRGRWLPDGLRLQETVVEVAMEAALAVGVVRPATVVMCIGSGVMAAGVLCGVADVGYRLCRFIGVLAHSVADPDAKRREILSRAGLTHDHGLLGVPVGSVVDELSIVSSGYTYYETPDCTAPFPCDSHYDLKAWGYMLHHLCDLEDPVLFWNIGGGWDASC